VHDPKLASWIEAHISERMANAVPETLQSLAARPLVERLRNRVVWLASPYL
jgi:cardiolipin synthase